MQSILEYFLSVFLATNQRCEVLDPDRDPGSREQGTTARYYFRRPGKLHGAVDRSSDREIFKAPQFNFDIDVRAPPVVKKHACIFSTRDSW